MIGSVCCQFMDNISGDVSWRPIGRRDVILRARRWHELKVPYSQADHWAHPPEPGYRQDCSGFVSMAWCLPRSHNTETLMACAAPIGKQDLRQGDVIMRGGPGTTGPTGDGHVLLFVGWADEQRTTYWAYEQHGPQGTPTACHVRPYPYLRETAESRYRPYRYRSIVP